MQNPKTRKNPRAHKNKIGTSTPPPFLKKQNPPSKERNFVGMGGFPAERTKKPRRSQNWCSHFWPQNYGRKNTDMRLFLKNTLPPGTQPIHAGNNSWGIHFARIHAGGPVFQLRSREYRKHFFEEAFPEYFARFLGEFIRCEYMPRLHPQLRECR